MAKNQELFGSLLGLIFNSYSWYIGRKFSKIGKNCSIRPILNTTNPQNILLGNNVNIGMFCWIDTNTTIRKDGPPRLSIGSGVSIGAYSMIIAAKEISIGNNVLMSERVTILDHIHDYRDISRSIIDQPLQSKGKIVIEDDCFIGVNAVILQNVRIGKHAVIGANAVVTHDVPSYSVAAGAPAKIIKRYDFQKKRWVRQ